MRERFRRRGVRGGLAICALAFWALGCDQESFEAPSLELKPYRAGEAEESLWARSDDVRTALVQEDGESVTIPGRGRFVTAVARAGEAECLLNDVPVASSGDWVEIREELRRGATLAARGGQCAWDSPRFVQPGDKLDVILILLDTFRADRLAVSPALTELEQRSYRFREAYANASWTRPSHEALFSGRVPPVRMDRERGLAQELAEAGWRTSSVNAGAAITGKIFGRGFEKFVMDFNAIEAVDRVVERELDRGEPTFLFFHTYEVHDPYRHFEDAEGPLSGGEVTYSFGTLDSGAEDPEGRARVVELYDAGVRFVDRRLRELFEVVDWDSTVVIVTSDHGEPFWEHGYWRHGIGLYQEVLRVPLLIYLPESLREARGLAAPREFPVRAQLIDIAPTLLDLLGVASEMPFDGRSLVPVMAGERESQPPVIARGIFRTPFDKDAVLDGPFKLIRTRDRETGEVVELELFNLVDDPEERVNLVESDGDTLIRLLALLESGAMTGDDLEVEDPENLKALQALGYIN